MAMKLGFVSVTMIFIGLGFGETTLSSISRHTLHNYNMEFQVGIIYLFMKCHY